MLTEVGTIMARHIVTVMQDAARTEEQINALSGRHDGRLRIMAVEGIAGQLMPALLERILSAFPTVELHVEVGAPKTIVSACRMGGWIWALLFRLHSIPNCGGWRWRIFPSVRSCGPTIHLQVCARSR